MCFVKMIDISSSKILEPKTILSMSDIHYMNNNGKILGLSNLKSVHKVIFENGDMPKIDTILITGDVINDVRDLEDREFRKNISSSLRNFTNGIPTFISYGNHDQMIKDTMRKWTKADLQKYRDFIASFRNIYSVENNELVSHEGFNLTAYSPDFDYYERFHEDTGYFMNEFISTINPSFDDKTYNILLTHSSSPLLESLEDGKLHTLENTDLVLSGHMHNGVIPFAKTYGLISSQSKFFSKYTHGDMECYGTLFVINGAVNPILTFPVINNILGPSVNIITLNKGNEEVMRKRLIKF